MTAVGLLAAALVPAAQAQNAHRRHENNVSRQYRLARAIEDTYSHRWEVAGGGGFLRFEPGPYLRRDNQIDWATSGTYYFTDAYGVVADVRGHFGDTSLPNSIYNGVYHPLITEYTMMAGPQWRFYRKEKYAVSGHVLAGLSMGNFDGGSKGIPAPLLGMWPTANVFAASAGVNFDYNFYPNLAFRVQPTYLYTHFGGANQNNKGMNFELLYRFGRIK
jgi:hypothetical protein